MYDQSTQDNSHYKKKTIESLRLDRFSDSFLHNKNKYYHPKRGLNYSPSNLVFIDEKPTKGKRIQSGNLRYRRSTKPAVEFGEREKLDNRFMHISSSMKHTGDIIRSENISPECLQIGSITINRINRSKIYEDSSFRSPKITPTISKCVPNKKSQNMEYCYRLVQEPDIPNLKTTKRVQSKRNKRRKNNKYLLTNNNENIKERLLSAHTFKLTGLNPSQKSSEVHELSEKEELSEPSIDNQDIPDFKLDDPNKADFLSPDERDQLDAEIINEIKSNRALKRPYIEGISTASYFLSGTHTKLMESINEELQQKQPEKQKPKTRHPSTKQPRKYSKIGFFQMELNDLVRHEKGILNLYKNDEVPASLKKSINNPKSIFKINLTKEDYSGIFDKDSSFYEKQAFAAIFRKKWKKDQGYCSLFDKRKKFIVDKAISNVKQANFQTQSPNGRVIRKKGALHTKILGRRTLKKGFRTKKLKIKKPKKIQKKLNQSQTQKFTSEFVNNNSTRNSRVRVFKKISTSIRAISSANASPSAGRQKMSLQTASNGIFSEL
ncbi:unnamed protein product [Moneuplotes crassus]|uniref:Uncharacterized protein n=1 Tax=Euplotes crassus TaxID=5936 RepID=A0AAD1X2S5_EUPCR|nr:unnamed protein product [Moneuplotes crassus]